MTHTTAKLDIRLKRAYLPPSPEDGVRVLVDRLWPPPKRRRHRPMGKGGGAEHGAPPLVRSRPEPVGRVPSPV